MLGDLAKIRNGFSVYTPVSIELDPFLEKNVNPCISQIFQLVKTTSRAHAVGQLSKLPFGAAVYYPSSQIPNVINIILNEPGIANLKLDEVRVEPIQFQFGLQYVSSEEIEKRVITKLKLLHPSHFQIYETEDQAQEALKKGQPYALWGCRNEAEKTDQFGLVFPDNEVLEVIENLTGITPIRHNPTNSHNVIFSDYKKGMLEERVALLNSLKKALHNHIYPNREEAEKFIREENLKKAILPRSQSCHLIGLAFFRKDEELMMLYHFNHGVEPFFTKKISQELDKIWKDQEVIIKDIQQLRGDILHPVKIEELALFEVQADRGALENISKQVAARHSCRSRPAGGTTPLGRP